MGEQQGLPAGQPEASTGVDSEALAAQLDQIAGASEWQVRQVAERETQLFVIGTQVEARRTVTNQRAQVLILNDHAAHAAPARTVAPKAEAGQDGTSAAAASAPPELAQTQPVRGWATFTLLAADASDPARLRARLDEGVFMAGLTDNQPYHLPTLPPEGFPAVQISDPALAESGASGQLERELETARATLEAAVAAEVGVRLSSAELFLTRESLRVRNSRHLTGASTGTRVALDAILIAREGEAEAEVHIEMERRRLADLDLGGTIAAYAGYARDTLRAVTPPTSRGPVVVSGPALPALLTPLIFHASAQARFLGISRFTLGQPLTGAELRGDRLSLSSDALYPFGTKSAPFDAEGVPATRVALVVDGVVRAHWAEQRYAEYLGIPATGAFANLVLGAGNWPAADLVNGGTVYQIVEFSFMNPDPVSGDFASEIRLGYRHDPDGTVTPIKGGTLSGNLFDALADIRLSHETQFAGDYVGPVALRFGQLTIAGE
jgi:PmbA protein